MVHVSPARQHPPSEHAIPPDGQQYPSVVQGPPVLQQPPLLQVAIHACLAWSGPRGSNRGSHDRAVYWRSTRPRRSSLSLRKAFSAAARGDSRIAANNTMNFMVNVPNILSTSSERTNLRIGEVREGEERTRGWEDFQFYFFD